MVEETAGLVLARLLFIAGGCTKEHAIEMAYSLLTILDEDGWILIRKDHYDRM